MPLPDVSWDAAFVVGFMFVIGATLGSFLNVVAHRLPAGESVVHGGSRCPHCRSPVRPRDNIPIVAWCLLRGRCRDCGGPISPRYPAIEAACGAVVAVLAAADLGHGPGIDAMVTGSGWRTVALLALHTWLATTLLAWGLLAADGHPIGTRTLLVAVLIAAGGVAVASLTEQPWNIPVTFREIWSACSRSLPALAARVLGASLGWLAGRWFGSRGTAASLTLAALVCGWQALPIMTVVTLLLQAFATRQERAAGTAGGLSVLLPRVVSVPIGVAVAVMTGAQG